MLKATFTSDYRIVNCRNLNNTTSIDDKNKKLQQQAMTTASSQNDKKNSIRKWIDINIIIDHPLCKLLSKKEIPLRENFDLNQKND